MSWKTSVRDILGEALDTMTYNMDIHSNEYKDLIDFFNYQYYRIVIQTEQKYILESESIKYALDMYVSICKEKITIDDYNWKYLKTTEHYQVFKKQRKNKPFKCLKPMGM